MVDLAANRLSEGIRQGMTQSDAWNSSTCDWTAAATVMFTHS